MNTMKVDKYKLLTILEDNRTKHRDLFLKAQESYRNLVIGELDNMLTDARKGASVRRHVNLMAPIDHTNDYDQMIGLLGMSQDTFVDLTIPEFTAYVNDKWSWSQRTTATNSTYASGLFVAEDAQFPSSY